jgi:UDP-N-acetylglucosamine--N-acetylmuramyl-(pentapeptide) pyrophosphoryl-undecaprenol N-acetylglucosamine transferase
MGNPIRPELLNVNPALKDNWKEKYNIPTDLPLVLILGGSLGAQQINELIFSIKESLSKKAFLLHQTGKSVPSTQSLNYLSLPFLNPEDMGCALSLADLVISRSGAGSLAELSYFAKPMILIPLQSGSRGDQVRNSAYFEHKRACLVLKEDVTPEHLLIFIKELLLDPSKREDLALKAKKLSYPDAAKNCASAILKDFL